MNKDNIIEVVNKLIGPIDPVADAAIDRVRLENLKLFIDVFDEMFFAITDIPRRWEDSKYGSVRPLVDLCNKELNEIKQLANE